MEKVLFIPFFLIFFFFFIQVTSKPDLYPLVFSYTGSDGGKGGTNYLMVQYFRNYIVRPVGSLSAASTVDSLSSSFIRSVNEANTLVPPPYSRATSPDLSFSLHNYAMPRSTSQQACSMILNEGNQVGNSTIIYRPCSVPDSNLQSTVRLTSAPTRQISESESMDFNNCPVSVYSNNSNSVHINLSQIECGENAANDLDENLTNNLVDDNIDSMNGVTNINSNSNRRDESLDNSMIESLDCIESDDAENDNDETEAYGLLLQQNLTHYRNMMKMQRSQKNHQSISFESKESQISECPKVHGGYLNSNTDSSVSSLANLGSPASPPRPTSPTFEVREILEQIRQIQSEADNAFLDTLTEGEIVASSFTSTSNNMPNDHTSNTNSFTLNNFSLIDSTVSPNSSNNSTSYGNNYTASIHGSNRNNSIKRNKNISTNYNNKNFNKNQTKKISTKTNRDLYLPISNISHHQNYVSSNSSSSGNNQQNDNISSKKIRNSATSSCILHRGRFGTRGWISKSAPTTPAGACNLPLQFGGIDDSSPLLDEQDEEEDAGQNV